MANPEKIIPPAPSAELDADKLNSSQPPKKDRLRAAATGMAVAAWSNGDIVALVAAGEVLKNNGVNGWASGAIIATAATAETFYVSHLASKGMGDFSYNPKTKLGNKMASYSPLVSAWRGAPTGVMIDETVGKEVDTRRRLVHAVPYGVAIGGLWVAPNPVRENVISVASPVAQEVKETASANAFEGVALMGAVALAYAVHKIRGQRA